MPRYSTIRLPALVELAKQLRFAPKAAAMRQIHAILKLADEIDPAHAYAQAWVVRRITGYRGDDGDAVQLVGEALLGDLSAFAERLSAQSKISRADLDEPVITLRALMDRWSVTPRTIERYRRKGLLALRLRPARGAARLVFVETSVQGFESRHRAALADARSFARAPLRSRSEIVALAAERAAESPPSMHRVATELAPRAGVSPSTVRRILRADAPTLIPVRRRAASNAPSTSLRLWREGVGPSDIARRLKTTRLTANRLISAERARLLRSLALETLTPVSAPPAAAIILEDPLVRLGFGGPGDTDAVALAAAAAKHEAPDPSRERKLAAAHYLLRARAAAMLAAHDRFSGEALDQIETDLRWIALLRIELVRGERALIVRTIEERAGVPMLDLPAPEIRRWTAAAFDAAAHAVDRFDPAKRGRLAAPVSFALARVLAGLRAVPATPQRAHPATMPITDWSRRVAPWQAWLDPPERVINAVNESWADEQTIRSLRHRFGLALGPPLTLKQMKSEQGVSPASMLRCLRLTQHPVPSAGRSTGPKTRPG